MSRVTGNGVAELSVAEYVASIFRRKVSVSRNTRRRLIHVVFHVWESYVWKHIPNGSRMEETVEEEQDSFRKNDFLWGINLNTFRRFIFYFSISENELFTNEWCLAIKFCKRSDLNTTSNLIDGSGRNSWITFAQDFDCMKKFHNKHETLNWSKNEKDILWFIHIRSYILGTMLQSITINFCFSSQRSQWLFSIWFDVQDYKDFSYLSYDQVQSS